MPDGSSRCITRLEWCAWFWKVLGDLKHRRWTEECSLIFRLFLNLFSNLSLCKVMCMVAYFYIQMHACSQRGSSLQHSFGWKKNCRDFFFHSRNALLCKAVWNHQQACERLWHPPALDLISNHTDTPLYIPPSPRFIRYNKSHFRTLLGPFIYSS